MSAGELGKMVKNAMMNSNGDALVHLLSTEDSLNKKLNMNSAP